MGNCPLGGPAPAKTNCHVEEKSSRVESSRVELRPALFPAKSLPCKEVPPNSDASELVSILRTITSSAPPSPSTKENGNDVEWCDDDVAYLPMVD